MCGRYANHVETLHGWESLLVSWPEEATIRFNVCPTQIVPAFTESGGVAMRWSLVPGWSDEVSSKYATFNARVETIQSKPAFRHAWSASQCCLIPALGYYEWRAEQDGKQPYFVRAKEESLIVFAGLYEPARDESIPASCTIITRPATLEMSKLHPRMPAMLKKEQAEAWIDRSVDKTKKLALLEGAEEFTVYPVSKKVNNTRNEGSDLMERASSEDMVL